MRSVHVLVVAGTCVAMLCGGCRSSLEFGPEPDAAPSPAAERDARPALDAAHPSAPDARGDAGASAAACPLTYSEGHGDLYFVEALERLDLRLRSAFGGASAESLQEPERVCIVVAASSLELTRARGGAPSSADYRFLGVPAGEPFWLLPQSPQNGIPWFGFSTEALATGHYVGDSVQLELALLSAPAGAHLAVWSTGALGAPELVFSTFEGVVVREFSVGAHLHFNWSFSHAGDYRLQFRARAEGLIGAIGSVSRQVRIQVVQ